MLMDVSVNQWYGILEYFVGMIVLFTGVFIISMKLADITTYRNKRVIVKVKKTVKKQVFFDVA
jgi:hypothetical protein